MSDFFFLRNKTVVGWREEHVFPDCQGVIIMLTFTQVDGPRTLSALCLRASTVSSYPLYKRESWNCMVTAHTF